MKRFVGFCAAAALFAAPALATPAPEPVTPESARENPQGRTAPPEGTGGSDPNAVTPPPPGTPPPPTEEDVGISTEPGTGGAGIESPEQDREIRRQPSSGPDDAQGPAQQGATQQGAAQPEEDSPGVMQVERRQVAPPGELPELNGRVLRADEGRVDVDFLGQVVTLEVDEDTHFEGGLEDAEDLQPGQRIGAEFEVEDQQRNVAQRIWLGEAETETGTGIGGSGNEGGSREDLPDHQGSGELPADVDGGAGGSGSAGGPASDFEPVPDEDLRPPTEDRSIMGNEGGTSNLPAQDEGTGGAADEGAPGDDEERRRGAVFDTGDTSGRQPGTIPEGDEPGPGSPLPAPADVP